LNVFLQLFDDGRLTDHQGRTANFRQCVVILTSNQGAAVDSRNPLGFGGVAEARFSSARVERELTQTFRPELLNRIDRIVVFRPFERDQVRALLERELAQVLERRGFRNRPWAVEWDEAALEFLAEKGFSVELGARPLKRAVERYLLAPVAEAIVSRRFPEGEQFLFITARDDRIEVTFVDPDAEEHELEPAANGELRLEQLVLGPRGGAEETTFLQSELARLRAIIDGEGWRGCKERDLAVMQRDGFWDDPSRFALLARIEYVDRVQAALRTAEKLAGRLASHSQNGHGSAHDLVRLLAERLYLLDRACADTDASAPADAFLQLKASEADPAESGFALQLRDMYEAWSRRRGMRVRRLESDGGHLLAVTGIGAHAILAAEAGLHVLEAPNDERSFDRVAVSVVVAPAPPAAPDTESLDLARVALNGVSVPGIVVRRYRLQPSPLVRDSVRDWRTGRLDRVLAGDFDLMIGAQATTR
jgi:ATP-dependent Clp protease ATP-binding subunit ClpC